MVSVVPVVPVIHAARGRLSHQRPVQLVVVVGWGKVRHVLLWRWVAWCVVWVVCRGVVCVSTIRSVVCRDRHVPRVWVVPSRVSVAIC